MDTSPQASSVSPRATVWAVALLTAMNLLNYIDRYVLPANIEVVRHDIHMTDAEQGRALTAFLWVYMLAAPIFGRLGDRSVRKYLIAFGVGVWSIATAAASMVHTLHGLYLARALVGIGEAAYATIAPSLISDYYPEARRGKIMAIFYVATPVGSAMGYVLGGNITQSHGWRDAFLAVGLPGLAIALLALTIREPPRGQFDAKPLREVKGEDIWAALRRLSKLPAYLWNVAGMTAYTFAIGGLSLWMPTYLQRIRHMDVGHANTVFGAITVITGLAGTGVGGVLGEALRGRIRHPYLVLSGVSTAIGVPFSILAFRFVDPGALWTCVFIAEFFLFLCTGPINTVLLNCLPGNLRTTGFALSIMSVHLFGDAVSPNIIGWISDQYSLQLAVMIVPLAFGVCAALWLYAARTLKEAT